LRFLRAVAGSKLIFEFEIEILQWLNSLAGQYPVLDRTVMQAHRMATVKMLLPMALLWYLWFKGATFRRQVFSGILGGVLALAVSRLIQNFSPHRPRPALSDEFEFTIPAGASALDWSSFPSDHAAITFAIATAIFAASRPLGLFTFAYVTVVACLPRLYGGYHYPSDLLAGAAIGVLCVKLASLPLRPIDRLYGLASRFEERNAPLFYLFAFIICFQLTTFFDDIRRLGTLALIGLRSVF
ncbi:MAG: phosphatase PAP2 family protein, partial [Pseudomonadota bacterium]|nr:phosphatase PAP2 family protein [Pseudomonadota bacterium]